jgi:hypothetical protein
VSSTRFPGVRDPDFWSVQVEGDETSVACDTEALAEKRAADERRCLMVSWREVEGDTPFTGPDVRIYPVWVGDPRLALLSAPEPAETGQSFNPLTQLPGEYDVGRTIRAAVEHDAEGMRFCLTCSVGELAQRIAHLISPAPTAAEPESEAPTPEKLRAMADWFDDPKNPLVATHLLGGSLGTASYLLRRFATAITLATPEAEGGEKP